MEGAFPGDYEEAGQKWADAYTEYAANAMTTVGAAAPDLTLSTKPLAATLTSVFGSLPPGGVGALMAPAFATFWLDPPVFFSGAKSGLVTVAVGIASLPAALDAAFAQNAVPGVSADDAGMNIANALHAFTLTVQVLLTAPPPPVLSPIS
jgi:hypothetical protein